jgi:hypothetical protein
MSSKEYASRLAQALERTGLVTVKNEHFGPDVVRILCRVKQGQEPKWIALVKTILLATDAEQEHAHRWAAHICRHYFLKGEKSDLVYGWNVSISSQQMGDSLDYLIRAMKGEKSPTEKVTKELTEIPLNGTASRNVPNEKGKGAYAIGSRNGGDYRPPSRSR